nr:class I SAM-dependent methyltransferase [Candidatus Microthrix sp.]
MSPSPTPGSPSNRAELIPRPDQPLPTGDAKVEAVRAMFDTIAPNYDKVNRIMTGRLDVRWRRTTVDALGLAPTSIVADLAAGTGDLVYELQDHGMSAIGVDLSMGMLAAAPRPFPRLQGDALSLPFPDGSLDGVTCGFALRNFESLPRFFAELARVLRPGGRIGLLEVGQPSNPVLKAGFDLYFGKVVPKIGARFSDARLRLPAPLGRLSAATDRDPSPDRRCRLRPVPSSPADRWPRPAVHGHAATELRWARRRCGRG